MVGQGLGAGDPERAEKAVWIAGKMNLAFLGTIGVLFIIFAPGIVSVFGGTGEASTYAIDCLRIVSAGFFFYPYGMVLTAAFHGAGAVWAEAAPTSSREAAAAANRVLDMGFSIEATDVERDFATPSRQPLSRRRRRRRRQPRPYPSHRRRHGDSWCWPYCWSGPPGSCDGSRLDTCSAYNRPTAKAFEERLRRLRRRADSDLIRGFYLAG